MTVYNNTEAFRKVTTEIHNSVMKEDKTWMKPDMAESAVVTFLIEDIAYRNENSGADDSLADTFNFAEVVADVRVWMIWFLSNQEDMPACELIRLHGVRGAAQIILGRVIDEDDEALKKLADGE